MARQQPEIPDGIPPTVKARLRDEQPWNNAALMVYAMRNPALVSWAEVLFQAETEGCPRERSDAFIRTIAVDLASVVADGNVDPDGIINAFSLAGAPKRINGWYDRRLDLRKADDCGRIVRNARYIQKLLREGRVTQSRDLTLEVRQNVPVAADRPLIEDILRKAKPNPQGRFSMKDLKERLIECGISIDSWKPLKASDKIKGRLNALREEADAPLREQERLTQEARKAEEARVAEAARAAEAARVAEAARCRAEEARVAEAARAAEAERVEEDVAPEATPPPAAEPEVEEAPSSAPSKTRGYNRRPKDLSPKTEPTVIKNPSPRDVAAHRLMTAVLDVLTARVGKKVPFIPSVVMQVVAASAFENYKSSPGVGVSQMGYKGYVTNVAGIPAAWRLDPVDVGDVVVPDELQFEEGAAADIVRMAYEANPAAFDAGIALVFDEKYAAHRPVEDHAPDADRGPYAVTSGDSDGEDDTDNDTNAIPGGGDVDGGEDEEVREDTPVVPDVAAPAALPVVLDESAIERIVSRLLDARAAAQEPPPAPVSEARIAEMVEAAVRRVEVPTSTLDQGVLEAAVRDVLLRLVPLAVQDAVEAQLKQTAEELGRQHAAHEQRLTALRKELEEAERAACAARLRDEAAKLVAAAVAAIGTGKKA